MPVVTVIYPAGAGTHFDFDYYERTHLPLVARHWGGGLKGAEALKGRSTPDGRDPPYVAIALLRFGSMEDFRAAMGVPARPRYSATSPISPTSSRSCR